MTFDSRGLPSGSDGASRDDANFRDELYEWMRSAPWLVLSAAAHLLLLFVLAAVPWQTFLREPERIISMIAPEPPPPMHEPEELPEPELEPVELPPDEPVEMDSTLEPLANDPDPFASVTPAEELARTEFDAPEFGELAEVGMGAGPRPGGGGGGGRTTRLSGTSIEPVLEDALAWLRAHQSPEGNWDADGFDEECGALGATICSDAGSPEHDVGVTGLALLAFLGMGNTTNTGVHRDVVRNAVRWLKARQDPDSGLIGDRGSREFVYDHAIATLALCENYYATRSPTLKRPAQQAVDFILAARDPYGAWRYDVPSLGESDVSVTGWMVFALRSAADAGLRVEPGAFVGARAFLDDMTDPSTGRVGYLAQGSASSRVPGVNDRWPVEGAEAMTAVGVLCRIFLGDDPSEVPALQRGSRLMLRALPEWRPDEHANDMYYWYYGTYAMFQMGAHEPELWRRWEASLGGAVIASQRRDGDERGSWDPTGPWGGIGGRVYATALMTLTLEVKLRYTRVLGAR